MDVPFADRVDPALRPLLESMVPLDLTGDIPAARAASAAARAELLARQPEVPGVVHRDVTIPGWLDDPDLLLRIYEPEAGHHGGALSYIHGGGMVLMTVADSDFQCRKLVEKTGCLLTSVEYRLAPEHPFPAAIRDCYAALLWLHDHADDLGVDRRRIALGGQSAGGGLAAGTALLARDQAKVPLCLQWLIYPMIDDRNTTASSHEIVEPRVWNRASNLAAWAAYLGELAGADGDVPLYAAPARATVEDLVDLPPTYLDVGQLDAFRDENIAYAQRLMAAGVPVELHVTPGVFHAAEGNAPGAPVSRRINAARFDALRRALAP